MLPRLETTRLSLREMELADGPALDVFQSRPFCWRHQAVEPPELADSTERVWRYQRYRGADDRRILFVYVAALKSTDTIVGTVGLTRGPPGTASLSIGISEDYAKRGLGTELAARFLAFGFEELQLHRIQADIALENTACIRLVEKIGMTREGVARDCIYAQGRWWTEAKYAMLEDEQGCLGVSS
jgi:ribosomal-protein-alanine N-acetyltransferase